MKDYASLPQAEKDALVAEAMKVAHDTEFGFGSCAQSVLGGLRKVFPDLGITDEIFTASFGLAGGCGCSLLGTCGALSGAAMAISAICGRPASDMSGDYEACYTEIQKIVPKFAEKYNGVLCKDVMITTMGAVYDWQNEEGAKGYNDHDGDECCAQAVATAAGLVAQMIVDGEIK